MAIYGDLAIHIESGEFLFHQYLPILERQMALVAYKIEHADTMVTQQIVESLQGVWKA